MSGRTRGSGRRTCTDRDDETRPVGDTDRRAEVSRRVGRIAVAAGPDQAAALRHVVGVEGIHDVIGGDDIDDVAWTEAGPHRRRHERLGEHVAFHAIGK